MAVKKVKKKKQFSHTGPSKKLIGIIIVVLVIFSVLGYSVFEYSNSQEEQEGFFVCNSDKTICELSQHIHADITMTVCGEEVLFPKEKGRTDLQHTHKEKNKIHWHARIQVDPNTKEPLDPAPLTLEAFLKQMEYSLPNSCPQNQNPSLSVIINGQPIAEQLQYVWKDHDQIVIEYK